MLFESKAEEIVKQSLKRAKDVAEINRKQSSRNRLKIYHDDWDDILNAKLKEEFTELNYKGLKLTRDTSQNILKKVVNEISLVYKRPPERIFEPKVDAYTEILENIRVNVFMKKINRYTTLLNDTIIHVPWNYKENAITKLQMITPDICTVIQNEDDPETIDALWYAVDYWDSPTVVDEQWFVFWSQEQHFLFTEGGKIEPPTDENTDMINPYGELPFVFVHNQQIDGQFWNDLTGDDLITGCVWNGKKKSLKNYYFKHASFKQPYAIGAELKLPPELRSDPSTIWTLEGKGEIGMLDLTVAFGEFDKTMLKDVNDFLATYNLSVDMFAVSPTEMSGRALKIKNQGLLDIRENQIEMYRGVEVDLFRVIAMVHNYHSTAKKINEKAKLETDFPEPEMYFDPMEKLKKDKAELEAGIISPGVFYMRYNPDVKEEEKAEEKMRENLEKYREMKDDIGLILGDMGVKSKVTEVSTPGKESKQENKDKKQDKKQ